MHDAVLIAILKGYERTTLNSVKISVIYTED